MPSQNNFEMFAAQYDTALRAGADASMMSLLTTASVIMPLILVPAIIAIGVLWSIGQLGLGRAFGYIGRICVLVWLILGFAYVPFVRDFFVDDIPSLVATSITGSPTPIASARQFDLLDEANAHAVARVRAQATGLFNWPTRLYADVLRTMAKVWLELIFYLWIAVRMMTHLLVAAGPLILVLLIFENGRTWVMEFFGKLVGVSVWQIMTSVMLNITLTGMQVYMASALSNPGISLDEQLENLADIAGWFLGCFVLLLLVPAAAGIGSGFAAGAGQNAVMGMMSSATRSMGRVAASVDRLGGARGGGARHGGGSRR